MVLPSFWVPGQHSKYIRSLPPPPGIGTTSGLTTRNSPAPPSLGDRRAPASGAQEDPSAETALRIRAVQLS